MNQMVVVRIAGGEILSTAPGIYVSTAIILLLLLLNRPTNSLFFPRCVLACMAPGQPQIQCSSRLLEAAVSETPPCICGYSLTSMMSYCHAWPKSLVVWGTCKGIGDVQEELYFTQSLLAFIRSKQISDRI